MNLEICRLTRIAFYAESRRTHTWPISVYLDAHLLDLWFPATEYSTMATTNEDHVNTDTNYDQTIVIPRRLIHPYKNPE